MKRRQALKAMGAVLLTPVLPIPQPTSTVTVMGSLSAATLIRLATKLKSIDTVRWKTSQKAVNLYAKGLKEAMEKEFPDTKGAYDGMLTS